MVLDWSQCPAVESVPGKLSGAWVFRGTRMPVATVFENLEDGLTIDEIIEQFDVTREQVAAVLDFAARSLETADADSLRLGHAKRNCPSTCRPHCNRIPLPGLGHSYERRVAGGRRSRGIPPVPHD
jgi:uncharacterized protein (DUF433 family)